VVPIAAQQEGRPTKIAHAASRVRLELRLVCCSHAGPSRVCLAPSNRLRRARQVARLEVVARRASKRDFSADGEECDVAAIVTAVERDLFDPCVRGVAGRRKRVTGRGHR
jgi:hypothetical protein